MVDVSHISKQAMLDAAKYSTAPVIASHSSVAALCDHPRNMDDEQLMALKANGGVMQTVALNSFVKKVSEAKSAATDSLRQAFGITGFQSSRDMSEEQRAAYDQGMEEINKTWPPIFRDGLDVEYEQQTGESFGFSTILVAVLIALALVAGAAMLMRRRKQAAIDELAGVFSYTAELLAAGDEVREAIFNCYESLCQILLRRGFLRRDFETVREFELAIRNALPISEQALVALDRIFEEARYSSHVLGEPHRQNAQMALSTVLQEIDELQEVPERDSYIVDDGIR
jgi:hypothetical protein